MSEKSAVYECVDREHDAWRCRACGYIENFEADGPTENGWHFCPGCGREIIVEAVNPCPFDNDKCIWPERSRETRTTGRNSRRRQRSWRSGPV